MNTVAAGQLERIARGGVASLAGTAVAAIANFAVVVVITQSFSANDAGVLFSASSLFLIVLALVGLGMDTGLGRFLLRHVAEERWDWARQCLRNTAQVTIATSLVASVVMWFAAEPIAGLIGLPSTQGSSVVRVFACAVVLAALGNWALGASRAFANIRQTVLLDKVARSITQLALVAACAWAATGVTELSIAWVLPSVLTAPFAIWGLTRILARRMPAVERRTPVPEATRQFWRFTAPRSIAQVAQLIIQRLDIILITALISPAAAAIYTAATRFVPLGQLGAQAIGQVVQPRFTHLMATHQREALSEVFRTTTAWNIAVAWPIYLLVASMAGLYLQLFGQAFARTGVVVVLVMALGMMIGVASGPVDTILLMSGRSWLSLSNALVALAIDIAGCLVLIPRIGIVGAAIAWSVSVMAKSALGFWQVNRHEAMNPLSRGSLIVAVASVVTFALPGAALSLCGLATPWTFLALVLVGGAVYAAVLWRFRDELRLTALRALLPGKNRRKG